MGKTVQAIAFMAHLLEEGWHGVYLVVVPTSTISKHPPSLPAMPQFSCHKYPLLLDMSHCRELGQGVGKVVPSA